MGAMGEPAPVLVVANVTHCAQPFRSSCSILWGKGESNTSVNTHTHTHNSGVSGAPGLSYEAGAVSPGAAPGLTNAQAPFPTWLILCIPHQQC